MEVTCPAESVVIRTPTQVGVLCFVIPPSMQTLVFDIETIPLDFEQSFDAVQQEYLLRGCASDEEREVRKSWGGLNPLTGKVVCIGTFVHETRKGSALYLDTIASESLVEL